MIQKPYVVWATGATLWQSNQWIKSCFKCTFARLKRLYPQDPAIRSPTPAELEMFCGRALDDNLATILGEDRPALLKEGHDLYRLYHDAPKGSRAVQLYPGIRDTLTQLHQTGHILFVATEKATEAAEGSLIHHGLRDLFTGVQGADKGGAKTTKAQVLTKLMHRMQTEQGLSLDPTNMLLVEGRARGVQGALDLGMMSVGTLWGGESPAAFEGAGAAWIAATPQEVLALLATVANRPAQGNRLLTCSYPAPHAV